MEIKLLGSLLVDTGLNRWGFIPRSLLRFPNQSEIRHSRMFQAGIQANPDLDPGLKHSGVAEWESFA
jgi:hypothetical protein